MTELEQLKAQIASLQQKVDALIKADRYSFSKDLVLAEGVRILPLFNFDDPTGRQDISGSGGSAMTTGIRFNGNTGSDYYSVGDIVYALKQANILKNQ